MNMRAETRPSRISIPSRFGHVGLKKHPVLPSMYAEKKPVYGNAGVLSESGIRPALPPQAV